MEQPMFGRKLESSLEKTSRRSKGKVGCCSSGAFIIWGSTRTTPDVVGGIAAESRLVEREPDV